LPLPVLSIRLLRFIFFLSLRAGFTIALDQTITWSLGLASGDAVSSALFLLRFVASALSANDEKPSFREILRLFFLALQRNSIFKSIYEAPSS
jgi:hypothetical protein